MSTPDETYYDMSVPTLLTLAGPLLLFTWGIGTALMLPAQYSELFDTTVFLLFCLIGLAVSSVVCFLTADMRHVRYNALIAALCSIPTIGVEAALACTPVPLPLCAACAFFQGVAAGYMLVCWTAYLGVQANEHFAAIFVFEMVFAALLAFLVNNLASPVDHMTFAVLYVISTAALVLAIKMLPSPPDTPRETSRKRRPMQTRTHLMFGLIGTCIGVAMHQLTTTSVSYAIVVAAVTGCGIAFLDIRQAKGVYPDRMKRIMVVASVVLLVAIDTLPTSWPTDKLWNAFTVLISYYFVMQFSWTVYTCHRFQLNTAAFLSEAHLPIWIGLAVGCGAGWVAQQTEFDMAYVRSLLIVALVAGFALLAPGDNSRLRIAEFKEFSPTDQVFRPTKEENRRKRFEESCNTLALSYGLTPRETEIMKILAKGRNADYICSLLVISKHTAKTHIYHIYRKLGINTQQALMDMVESSFDVEGR